MTLLALDRSELFVSSGERAPNGSPMDPTTRVVMLFIFGALFMTHALKLSSFSD